MICTRVPIISTIGEKNSVSIKAAVAYVNREIKGACPPNDMKKSSGNDNFFSKFSPLFIMVGTAGAFAMMIATTVVFFNGIVVYFLSRRYHRSGHKYYRCCN